jgi:hypothetical protein
MQMRERPRRGHPEDRIVFMQVRERPRRGHPEDRIVFMQVRGKILPKEGK